MDTEVHFQKMASKQRAREVIEINSDDDDEAPAAKPSPPKRARVKVVVPPCGDTPAPRNLPARVDCIAPPHLPLPAAGGWTLLREETGATSDAFMWPHATPVPYCGGGIYQEKDARKGGKKARKVVSRVARILGVATVAVRIDDKAAFERAAKNWRTSPSTARSSASRHPSVKAVVDYLAPAGQRFPCRAPMAEDATLTKSETPMSSFTIKALLRDAESGGIATPAAFAGECAVLGVELRPYQVQNVFWMLHQEDQAATARTSVAGLNGYYWERRVFPDGGDEWFYFPHGGHVLLEPPPVTGGGLLADEMGYGKTVSALALIALDKKRRPAPPQEAGTLVVVPAALFRQWLAECREKAPGLKVAALDARATTVRPADVLGADVCLLRLDQLSQFKVKVAWRRVIVDECQFVANDVGVFAKSVAGIAATNVWMLSGTPITTKIEDLQGEMSLLRVWPFTLGKGADSAWQNHFWESNCKNPWDRRQNECLPTFRSLVKGTMMRHSREQRTVADGAPLVPLPRLTTRWVGVDQDEDAAETYVCRRLELFGAALENAHLNDPRREAFARLPKVLRQFHAEAKSRGVAGSAKLSAVVGEIRRLRSEDITAQFVVVSQYGDVLDELQEALDPVTYTVDISLAAREGKTIPVGSLVEYREHAWGARAVDPRVVAVDAKSESRPAECTSNCPSRTSARNAVSPLPGADGRPCTEDEDCPKCKGSFGCGKLYPAGSFPKLKKVNAGTKQEAWVPLCTSAACRAERPVKKGKKVEDLPNLKPLSACPACKNKYGCGRVLRPDDYAADADGVHRCKDPRCLAPRLVYSKDAGEARGTWKPTGVNDRALEENAWKLGRNATPLDACGSCRGKRGCGRRYGASDFEDAGATKLECRDDRCLRPRIVKKGNKFALERNGSALKKHELRAITKKICGACDRQYAAPYPAEGSACVQCGSEEPLEDCDAGLPRNLYTVAYGGRTATNVVKAQLAAKQHRCVGVPSAPPAAAAKSEPCLTRGGYDNRFKVGDEVTAQRPRVRDGERLEVGMRVRVLDGAFAGSPGTVGALLDGDRYEVKSLDRRGALLEAFRSDPDTSVLLLTLATAGVGLNITNANKVVILEPFRFGSNEAQAAMRVHRIGQSRDVEIIKFFTRGTMDERLLKLRHKRGELERRRRRRAVGGRRRRRHGRDGVLRGRPRRPFGITE
ncbi:hypothetical protein JL720_13990 [Aureococcus anophagefferens]|nr:hypothetical protein JL720_13990 [Aureococcus anophagefferens]